MWLKLEIALYILASGGSIMLDFLNGHPSLAGTLATVQFIGLSAWSTVMFNKYAQQLDRLRQEIDNLSSSKNSVTTIDRQKS